MTDEVQQYGEDCWILEFVSRGPKNYSLKIRSRSTDVCKTICKVRGISINFSNEKDVSFERLKTMVTEEAPPFVVRHDKRIDRVVPFKIVSLPEKKTFRIVYTKRRCVENYDTLPYGYKCPRTC
ncbi:hypothetical protein J437_LFUL011865 [Ladona fulva]|uniref:Uncharacterized protein n=1 Tax=Ladona fulva TaxID=123851 RepID=A0A8K0KFY5_LADFU|nr:hypothetical protein J437_LFUL011865 [Ladona fulva]